MRKPPGDIVQAGLLSAKPIHGHARSLSGADLNAYMAAGISSDHELTSADDLMEKLRAGLNIELRGSHDHLLPEFVKVLNQLGHLPQTVTLCTDDVFPDDLDQAGGLDDVVRRLVKYGLSPNRAVQAATFNAANRLGRSDLGLLAPGRRADIAIFDDLEDFIATHVITNGEVIAKAGKLILPVNGYPASELKNSMKCPALSANDFRVASEGERVCIATIDQPRFTRWGQTQADVKNGFVVPPDDVTLISVTHRHGLAKPVPRVGYLREWGKWRGAFCTSVSHDSHNLTVFGGNEEDMACAANWVIEHGGGMAVAADGKILASLALPLLGLMSEAPLSEISADFLAIRAAMEKIVDWQPPLLVFKACFGATLACNSGPHQTDMGIADVKRGAPLANPVLEIL
jgi:adenine deaminase